MSRLPMVMPANRITTAESLDALFPGRMGVLIGVEGFRDPRRMPYALDNGRFSVWTKKREWSESAFWHLLVRAARIKHPPLWLTVPDVVADAEGTLKEWNYWSRPLANFQWPLALAVQDGMTVRDVKSVRPRPDVIFVGGSTYWKWNNLYKWTKAFPRVHVGRVNTPKMLWTVHKLGVESSDGTGWRFNIQMAQLVRYLTLSQTGRIPHRYRPSRVNWNQ